MELDQIKQQLKNIFEERLGMDVAALNVPDDAGLFAEEGWAIDSVDVIDLVLGIEKTFGVRLQQDAEVQKHFATLETLAAYIQKRVAEAVAA